MGNNGAKLKKNEKHNASTSKVTPDVEKAFVNLVGNRNDCLIFGHLKEVFSEGLAENLWNFLSNSKSFDDRLSLNEFAEHVGTLLETSTDIYVQICQPVLHLIKVCAEAAGAGAVTGDEPFIANLARNMSGKCSSTEEIIIWKQSVCPAFCNALHAHVQHVLLNYDYRTVDYSSEILTPVQMWYIHCCLPNTFFSAVKESTSSASLNWTPLYSSATHGISVNRFENNVFDYKGPTVSVFHLSDGRIFVLATEDIWRHSASRYGGPRTKLIEVSPKLMHWSTPSPIYCNFKIRSAVFGISFSDVMKIDKDFANLNAIEVWGCASSNAVEDQQRLRAWQNQQAEKIRKVPLPGNWDDNPDKTILEMAGFQFSNERKRMEMEKIARELC